MATRQTFIDLDDYGIGDRCGRVDLHLEIDGPSDYYVSATDSKTGVDVDLDRLSVRDRSRIDVWVKSEVIDHYADFMDFVSDQIDMEREPYDDT